MKYGKEYADMYWARKAEREGFGSGEECRRAYYRRWQESHKKSHEESMAKYWTRRGEEQGITAREAESRYHAEWRRANPDKTKEYRRNRGGVKHGE